MKETETTRYKDMKKFLTATAIRNQRQASKNRGHKPPDYTVYELREWAYKQAKFQALYDMWIAEGLMRWDRPSFDRIDDSKPYSLGNIQIMTAYGNFKKIIQGFSLGIPN